MVFDSDWSCLVRIECAAFLAFSGDVMSRTTLSGSESQRAGRSCARRTTLLLLLSSLNGVSMGGLWERRG